LSRQQQQQQQHQQQHQHQQHQQQQRLVHGLVMQVFAPQWLPAQSIYVQQSGQYYRIT
jgi:hypothetical protein